MGDSIHDVYCDVRNLDVTSKSLEAPTLSSKDTFLFAMCVVVNDALWSVPPYNPIDCPDSSPRDIEYMEVLSMDDSGEHLFVDDVIVIILRSIQ